MFEWLQTEIDKLNIKGRDDFYTGLIWQEIPFWFEQVKLRRKIPEIKWVSERRRFNEAETISLNRVRNLFNNNIGKVQADVLIAAGWTKRGRLFTDPINNKRYTQTRAFSKMRMRLEQTKQLLEY
jgi:hypothetical protein